MPIFNFDSNDQELQDYLSFLKLVLVHTLTTGVNYPRHEMKINLDIQDSRVQMIANQALQKAKEIAAGKSIFDMQKREYALSELVGLYKPKEFLSLKNIIFDRHKLKQSTFSQKNMFIGLFVILTGKS